MLCQRCHKNLATSRYAEVVDGEVTEQHLCAECLSSRQEDSGTGFGLTAHRPVLRKVESERATREAVRKQRACPHCSTTLRHVLEQGEVGCSKCYDTFGGEIESILEGLHHALKHKGKSPRVDDARVRLREELEAKRTLLRSVLKAEKYEEAARLRDEIRSLETGLSTPSPQEA